MIRTRRPYNTPTWFAPDITMHAHIRLCSTRLQHGDRLVTSQLWYNVGCWLFVKNILAEQGGGRREAFKSVTNVQSSATDLFYRIGHDGDDIYIYIYIYNLTDVSLNHLKYNLRLVLGVKHLRVCVQGCGFKLFMWVIILIFKCKNFFI